MVGNIWKNDLNLEIFWHFLWPNLNKWGKNDLKFSESLLLNKFETKYYETFVAILQKNFFIVLPVLDSSLPPEDDVIAKILYEDSLDNFHVNYHFTGAIWEKSKPAAYFKGSKMWIFKRKGLVWMTPFPWILELGF